MAVDQEPKSLIGRRRRHGDEDEDEESLSEDGDNHSDVSVITGADDDDLAKVSNASDPGASTSRFGQYHEPNDNGHLASTGPVKATSKSVDSSPKKDKTGPIFTTTSDTNVMTNGLAAINISQDTEAVAFHELDEAKKSASAVPPESQAGNPRQGQDQSRQRREADPTYIPSRGNFFMHDPRGPDQRGYGGLGRGRSRGRGFPGGPFAPASINHAGKAAETTWTHDLHETVNQPDLRKGPRPSTYGRLPNFQHAPAVAARNMPANDYRPVNFSTSKTLGKVQLRVALPQRTAVIPFQNVLVRQHTRLPDHRPPLRRDKPVRISLPDRPPRYIFPSQERSFIFIPRAMRPNQQGFGRSRVGLGPSSRRTSAYGGSVYSPSVAAMSRRSSVVRDAPREHMFSPAGSVSARVPPASRPVVRLPQGMVQGPMAASPAGSAVAHMGMGIAHGFPPPQTPQFEYYRDAATMHQPKPQKTISVSGIDSPAALSMHAPLAQEQQPFENQIPHHVPDSSFGSSAFPEGPPPPYYPYQAQGTPLSHIPERAIHAQPFQPPHGYPSQYFGQFAPQPGQYYPQVPVFVPQAGLPQSAPRAGNQQNEPENAQQPALSQVESNGMVYYVDPSQMQGYPPQMGYPAQDGFLQPPGYTVPGMGGMMTPSPEGAGWFYPGAGGGQVYYQQS